MGRRTVRNPPAARENLQSNFAKSAKKISVPAKHVNVERVRRVLPENAATPKTPRNAVRPVRRVLPENAATPKTPRNVVIPVRRHAPNAVRQKALQNAASEVTENL